MENKPAYEELEQRIAELSAQVKELKTTRKESERKFRRLFDSLQEGIWQIDKNAHTVLVNPNMAEMLGYSADEMIGMHLFEFMDEEGVRDAQIKLKNRHSGKIEQHEFGFVRKDGGKITALLSATPLFKDGAYSGLLAGVSDITERKQTERSLRDSEQLLNEMSRLGKIGGWEHDLVTRKAVWTKETYRIAEIDTGPIPGPDEHLDFYPPKDRELLEKAYRHAVETGEPFDLELEVNTAKGRRIWTRAIGSPEFEDGNCVKVKGTFQDITDQKRAELDLRESQNRFYTIFHANPAAVALTRLDNHLLVDVNRKWESVTGFTRSEVVGQTPFSLNFWLDPTERQHLVECTKRRGVADGEVRIRNKTGEVIEMLMSMAVVQLGHDKFLLTMAQDIAEKKRSEDALRKSEARYRSMMESMTDPVCICSADYTVEYMNPAMIRRVGSDCIGEPCHKILHGLEEKCEWCVWDKLESGRSIETSILSPKDNRSYRVSNMLLEKMDGSVSKMTIFRDITDYIDAVAEREKARAQLVQAQKMESIGSLAGGIAHDFNNILSSIIGFTELSLEIPEKGAVLEDNLREVYAAGKRAKDLVRQILAFARQSEEEIKPIQPGIIAKEVLRFIRSSMPVTIEIQQAIESDALIMGNPTQLHQILLNLCANAADAMEENGGVLDVRLQDVAIDDDPKWRPLHLPAGGYIEITVSDTGTGIPPETMNSIFEPYFTTKGPGKGTGMGLAVAHGIVESYGGRITVKSASGRGSAFFVYLPVTHRRGGRSMEEPDPVFPMGTERILFVDDEAPIAHVGALILEGLGYSVTMRTGSIEALSLFRSKPESFDLVVTDMTMPNMTGDRLAIELMKIRPDIPVILCTGFSKKISEEKAKAAGIRAFAYKPLVKKDLANTVRKVLDGGGRKH